MVQFFQHFLEATGAGSSHGVSLTTRLVGTGLTDQAGRFWRPCDNITSHPSKRTFFGLSHEQLWESWHPRHSNGGDPTTSSSLGRLQTAKIFNRFIGLGDADSEWDAVVVTAPTLATSRTQSCAAIMALSDCNRIDSHAKDTYAITMCLRLGWANT